MVPFVPLTSWAMSEMLGWVFYKGGLPAADIFNPLSLPAVPIVPPWAVSPDPELIQSGGHLPAMLPQNSSGKSPLHHSLPYIVRHLPLSRNVHMTQFWNFVLEFLGNISSFSAEFEAERRWIKAARSYHLGTSAWEEHQLRAERWSHLGSIVPEAEAALSTSTFQL